jgi:hypothetical protein
MRRRGAVLTEWAIVFVLVLVPLIVLGSGLYGWMVQSWSAGRALELAGERYATTGTWDEDYLLSAAAALNIPIVPGRDTIAINVEPAAAGCSSATTGASWGAGPLVCAGDLISITLTRTAGEVPPEAERLPFFPTPISTTATWSGVAQRDSTGNATAPGGAITGRVTDAVGDAVAGATVLLGGTASTTTGIDGAYAFSGLAGGTSATVRVQATGYLEAATTVAIPGGGVVNADFTLVAGKLVRVLLVPASETNRVSNGAFGTSTAGWGATADPFIADASIGVVSGRLEITSTAANPSGGARTTLTGTFRAGTTYRATMVVQGTAGSPVAVILGSPSGADYAAVSAIASGGVDTVTVTWTPAANFSSGVELAVRANNNEPAARTLYVDDVLVYRPAAAVTGATVTTTTGRRATEAGDGFYVFTLPEGSYTILATAPDGGTSTDSGAPRVICVVDGAGCSTTTGAGTYSFTLTLD